MRLIDADELMAKVNEIKYLRKRKAQMLVDECNEVEAIPIEWIEDYMERLDSVGFLLNNWRHENESNTCD